MTSASEQFFISLKLIDAAAQTSRRPTLFGVRSGTVRAAGVDEMEGQSNDVDAAPEGVEYLEIPADATPAEKLSFSQCVIIKKAGRSSWCVKCNFCGRQVTTSSHKMMYGHYLQTETGIAPCIDIAKLTENAPTFVTDLQAKQSKLLGKRT